MKKAIVSIMCLVIIGPSVSAQSSSDREEIQKILDIQEEAWNKGDIGEFMEYYWKSEEMTFQSGNNRLSGWEALLKRYRTTYGEEKMGVLSFSDLVIKFLSDEAAYVLGRFNLRRGEESLQGLYTIILKRFPEGWRIIHDHSSSE